MGAMISRHQAGVDNQVTGSMHPHHGLRGGGKSFGPAIFPFLGLPPLPVFHNMTIKKYSDIFFYILLINVLPDVM